MFQRYIVDRVNALPELKRYDGKAYLYAYLMFYGVAMTQFGDNDELLVQTFPTSLTRAALAWFIQIEISKIKWSTDLARFFIDHYKFNAEIALDREQLQRYE